MLSIVIVLAAIFVALGAINYLSDQGQTTAASAIIVGVFIAIPLGSGLLIYRGLRLTRNYGDQRFGWICVLVGTIVLTVYSLLWLAFYSIN
jgi:hypothetical protein